LLLCAYQNAYARLPEATFHHLGVEDGLPGTRTTVVTQGPRGLIWIGTTAGLVVYDGYQLTPIAAQDHPVSTALITQIEHDSAGVTWVATERHGLFRYDPAESTLAAFNPEGLFGSIIRLSAGQASIWMATESSVLRYIAGSNVVEPVELPESVSAIHTLQATGNTAAVATELGVFFTDNPATLLTFDSPGTPRVNSLYITEDGDLWAATRSGLFYANRQNGVFTEHTAASGSTAQLQGEHIQAIQPDGQGNYWLGGDRTGVCRINADGVIDCYRYRSSDNASLSANGVRSLLVDRDNNLWAATFAGVDRLDLNNLQFGRYTDAQDGPLHCLRAPGINAILAGENAVWLGSNSGLVRWDTTCTYFPSDKDTPNTLSAPEVYGLWREDDEHIWVATSAGLDLLNESSGNVRRNAAPSIGRTPTFGFAESAHGDLLVNARKAIFRRKPGSETFSPISIADEPLNTFIWSVEPTPTGAFWVATYQGLGILRSIDRPLEYLRGPDGEPLFTQGIGALYAEPNGNVWVGVDKLGLFLLNPDGEILERFDESSGLVNTEFSAIVPDKQNTLWISTRRGIARLNKASGQITSYRTEDGLQGEFFMQNAVDVSPDGRFYFGGEKGINVFSPANIAAASPVKPQLRSLFVDGQQVLSESSADTNGISPLLPDLGSLTFNHQNESFALEFLALAHRHPQRMRYAYLLEGANSNWTLIDAQNRRATYTRLRPGNYTFRFRAAGPHGDWVEGDPLAIEILPPPWLTPWAFAAYTTLLLATVLALFMLRTRALRKRTLLLEKRVSERTSTIEALLDKKNEELANLSHEFRTPLTLILGPIKQLLAKIDNDDSREKLHVVQRNSHRLLRMVDQLLQMERFKVQQALQPRPQRVKPIVDHIARSFEELAAEQEIHLTTTRVDDLWLAFAPDAFEKILLNLLSNALKYTDQGGDVCLSLVAEGRNAVLTVSDTGIGIAEDKQQQVFERYQRAVDEHSEKIVGTGIGLALVKELLEAHGGEITLRSTLGEGSTFIATMPIVEPDDDELEASSPNIDLLELELASLARSSSPATPAEQPTGPQDANTHILVVEDNDDMRRYIMESLAQAGAYQISAAANGEDGLALAQNSVPDLIISDVMMPVMDGFALVRALRGDDRTSHIPIILLTARGDRQSRLRGWNEKADEYLTKPFDEDELRLRVVNLLEVRSLLQNRFGMEHFPGHKLTKAKQDDSLNPRDQAFLDKFKAMIEQYHTEADFKVVDMASHMAMSERPLQRKLKALIGHTPNEYLRAFRLEKASELLRQGQTVADVAFAVGFSSQPYFSTCFKAHFGVTPSEFTA
jgi:signal transduction histidine kinase/ligand-binding sensor domain-containing protein/CheY-like chemotaxis protein